MTEMLKSFLLFALSACITSIILNSCKNYFNDESPKHKLFNKEELVKYNGIDTPSLYLSILGRVYDVTKGAKYYGPKETYHTFIGCDNSRSFVTGEFAKRPSDDVISFDNQQLRSLNHWVKFYKENYPKVGKLIGRFYNENGKLTPYGKEVKLLIKAAEQASANEDLEKLKFPPCNVEWDASKGTRVWCTKKSGGISRNWVGVPRQLYEPGAENYRCACIYEGNKNLGNIKEYEGCDPQSESCSYFS